MDDLIFIIAVEATWMSLVSERCTVCEYGT